ncbi:MAG: hypothetical protein WA775_00460 [Psychroserpens sp.]|uniref:hypothetical protein n=1 Tax=Psychroserpens sp. TaxID=2020870 RepID=UPI003C725560
MKTLKITFLLLAVLFLTVSGQSSDAVVDVDQPTFKTQKQYDLMAHAKKKAKLEPQG